MGNLGNSGIPEGYEATGDYTFTRTDKGRSTVKTPVYRKKKTTETPALGVSATVMDTEINRRRTNARSRSLISDVTAGGVKKNNLG